MRVFVGWHRIRDPGNAHAYAQRTLVNSYLAGRRRKSSTEVVSGELADRAGPQGTADLRLVLMQALSVLTPRARAVVVLRYWEDRSIDQVAALLGCSAGNVTSQSARALAKLRAHLGDSWLELCSAD